ncbi:LysM peptidoglycan-binding domain-containing protein [Nakamurella multipartita]|uniref:Peptidoglycan-binding LysM n=1 Tax=Nakamurella multipartita (strain ATCC 700099 / DSM 44233 / CIP 104796 / JCM 9543 / NBRC 105858 / Y-104) TaxID=479431 RepID=C8XEB5_NAKMY|nr:LysM domain-containing protein [Nakamurella multipartita]ACV77773.1 Peptidoglycan-binding LysM [Nakamurella multipartita DSM 44233]
MANDVKRKDSTAKQWSARLTMLLWVGGLAVLVTQLPPPGQLWAAVSGSAPVTAPAPLAAVASVLVTTAGLIAWLLVGWAAVVLAVGLIARLPGRSGRRARRLLPRIAPSAVGRLVAAAVGVSLLAGTAACAAPAGASASARPAPAVTAGAPVNPAVSPDVTPAPGFTTAAPTSSIAIDWPTPDPAIPGSTTPSPAAPSQTEPSQTAPTSTPGPVAPEPTSAAPASPSPTPPATTSPSPVPFSPTSESTVPGSPPPTATAGIPAQTPAPAAPPPASAAPPPAPADTGAPASTDTDTDTDTGGAVTVTVQPGDSLWRIAARTLGPGASDADIDNSWRAWYFTNQQVVGDDPDQIVPGQQLTAPTVAGQVRS